MPRFLTLSAVLLLAGCSQAPPQGAAPPAATSSRSTQTQSQSVQSQETLIPYTSVLTYPANWVELSRQRTGQ